MRLTRKQTLFYLREQKPDYLDLLDSGTLQGICQHLAISAKGNRWELMKRITWVMENRNTDDYGTQYAGNAELGIAPQPISRRNLLLGDSFVQLRRHRGSQGRSPPYWSRWWCHKLNNHRGLLVGGV